MRIQTFMGRPLQLAMLSVLGLTGSCALAQEPAPEQALTWTADDPELNWGPCPPFLPKGCAIAVLHGDPAKDNVDVFLKVPAKSTIPLHWHNSAERMVLVAGELHVTYDGQGTAVLNPGTYAYGPAKRPHDGSCVSSQPCVLFHCLRISIGCGAGRNHRQMNAAWFIQAEPAAWVGSIRFSISGRMGQLLAPTT